MKIGPNPSPRGVQKFGLKCRALVSIEKCHIDEQHVPIITVFFSLGEKNSGLSQLRDVILNNLANQLQKNRFGSEDDDHYR